MTAQIHPHDLRQHLRVRWLRPLDQSHHPSNTSALDWLHDRTSAKATHTRLSRALPHAHASQVVCTVAQISKRPVSQKHRRLNRTKQLDLAGPWEREFAKAMHAHKSNGTRWRQLLPIDAAQSFMLVSRETPVSRVCASNFPNHLHQTSGHAGLKNCNEKTTHAKDKVLPLESATLDPICFRRCALLATLATRIPHV